MKKTELRLTAALYLKHARRLLREAGDVKIAEEVKSLAKKVAE